MKLYESHKKANPNHHNTGRKQSPKTVFSAAVSWWCHFQLKASIGNLRKSAAQVVYHQEIYRIHPDDRLKVAQLYDRQARLLEQLADVQQEIAEWNVNKRWVD